MLELIVSRRVSRKSIREQGLFSGYEHWSILRLFFELQDDVKKRQRAVHARLLTDRLIGKAPSNVRIIVTAWKKHFEMINEIIVHFEAWCMSLKWCGNTVKKMI